MSSIWLKDQAGNATCETVLGWAKVVQNTSVAEIVLSLKFEQALHENCFSVSLHGFCGLRFELRSLNFPTCIFTDEPVASQPKQKIQGPVNAHMNKQER